MPRVPQRADELVHELHELLPERFDLPSHHDGFMGTTRKCFTDNMGRFATGNTDNRFVRKTMAG